MHNDEAKVIRKDCKRCKIVKAVVSAYTDGKRREIYVCV